METNDNRKYLYLNYNHSVSYDKLGWYLDDVKQAQDEQEESTDFATEAKEEAISFVVEDIKRYSSAFKHLAVLSGSGTSMDNGNKSGKTRTGLWESFQEDITEIKDQISSTGKDIKKY